MIKVNGQIVSVERFPNHEFRVKDFAEHLTVKNIVEFKFEQDLVALWFVKRRIDELGFSADLFIWYMPYSRMDRQIEGDIFALKFIVDFFVKMNFQNITILEPHSPKTVELFRGYGISVRDIYPTNEWLSKVMKIEKFGERDHVVYPDKGAKVRYANAPAQNVITFAKKRDLQSGKITSMRLEDGAVTAGAKCIIHDDLCSAGGTFMSCGATLKQLGASRVVLLVAHCEDTVFDGDLLKEGSPIDHVYTTHSILTRTHEKITIISDDVLKF